MAQNFRNYITRVTGVTPVDALGGAVNSYDCLISIRLAKKKKKSKYKGTSNNVPTNMALYNRCKAQAKKKFDVWPSAYGSAYLTKLYKSKGGTYRSKG